MVIKFIIREIYFSSTEVITNLFNFSIINAMVFYYHFIKVIINLFNFSIIIKVVRPHDSNITTRMLIIDFL